MSNVVFGNVTLSFIPPNYCISFNTADAVYKIKRKCFAKQNEFYDVWDTDLRIDARVTLWENIAENGGIRLAFKAYKNYMKGKSKKTGLPWLHYTVDQLFFIELTAFYCGKKQKRSHRIRSEDWWLCSNKQMHSLLKCIWVTLLTVELLALLFTVNQRKIPAKLVSLLVWEVAPPVFVLVHDSRKQHEERLLFTFSWKEMSWLLLFDWVMRVTLTDYGPEC